MVMRAWRQTSATVVDIKWTFQGYDELGGSGPIGEYIVTAAYEVNGQAVRTCFKTWDRFEIGDVFTVRYDPQNPSITDRTLTKSRRMVAWGLAIPLTIGVLWLWDKMLH